ncbi:MAG: Hsp20/alpha crystallin family protein [Candidatus Obscuribacterales bacterium]|nr:Hsp20/alpha crystallin family protein [Candidatus Obscuribacterales bacterium]
MFNLAPWTGRKVPMQREQEQPLYSLQREMNRIFDDFFRSPTWESLDQLPNFANEKFWGDVTPRVDMTETDKELLVKVELPGMTEKDVEISINRDLLTISGEKKQEKEDSEKGCYRMERQFGSFTRTIPLPYEIEMDKSEAIYKNGVLSIKMPRSVEQHRAAKSIPVKSV